MEYPKKYDPKVEELKTLEFWKNNHTYAFKVDLKKPFFSIDTPPPTVSGNMHIGHAFSFSQQDVVARYKKLKGFCVFHPFGTDDNGLPTEKLVEKLKNVRSIKMERGAFRKLCNDTIQETKADFISDWIRIGMSCDFSKSYSTIDTHCQKVSQKAFIDLCKKDLIYSKKEPMSWCVSCQTAIAQADFESKDLTSFFNDIEFKTTEGEKLVISTTRPEFIPACVALFANPEDERYKQLAGKKAIAPISNHEVPILFDAAVDKEKGTGLMMVCTFGDKEDIEKWKRHKLDTRIILNPDGKLNELTGKYAGLKIVEGRSAIIEDLKASGALLTQKQITHAVNVHERCSTEIEFLITRQWFIKILDKKQDLLAEVEKINWHPEFMKKRMIHWIENLNWDWCISRQRHFGIPFPVWRHKTTGKIILADENRLPVDPLVDLPNGFSKHEVEPETDVMDTWATSSLTPQICLSTHGIVPNVSGGTIPMSLRPQAHDIIRTWAFYTLVRSVYEQNSIPWSNIMISGYVLASNGDKMSKSKGNSVSPRDVLQKYSADALRFWAAGSKLGEDLPYKEQDLDAGNRFITKLWNSFRFLSNFVDQKNLTQPPLAPATLQSVDVWLLYKLNELIKENGKDFDSFEYDRAKYRTEQFFWNVFCDDYLEVVKDRLYKIDVYGQDAHDSGIYTTYTTLKTIVVMMSPITPFVSEAIWQYFYSRFEETKSVVDAQWPKAITVSPTGQDLWAGQMVSEVTTAIRKYKAENGKPLNSEIILAIKGNKNAAQLFELVKKDISGTAKVKEISSFDEAKEPTLVVGDLSLQIVVLDMPPKVKVEGTN